MKMVEVPFTGTVWLDTRTRGGRLVLLPAGGNGLPIAVELSDGQTAGVVQGLAHALDPMPDEVRLELAGWPRRVT